VGWARTRYGDRARFFCRTVDRAAVEELGRGSFDIVVAHGVVHHLDDDQARAFFGLAHDALKGGGRLVTADGCYVPGQSWLARFLLSMDRGRFVRGEESYVRLARQCFEAVRSDIRHDTFRVPYTIIFMECTA